MRKSAFTLIELLIVITVIGILVVALVANYLPARARSQDARRAQDMLEVKKALDNFYLDYNRYLIGWETILGDYSTGQTTLANNCPNIGADMCHTNKDWSSVSNLRATLMNNNYLLELPKDPINNTNYHYEFEPGPDTTFCSDVDIGNATNDYICSAKCYTWTYFSEAQSGTKIDNIFGDTSAGDTADCNL